MAHLDILGLSVVLREAEATAEKAPDTKQTEEEEKEAKEKQEALEEKKRKACSTIVLSVTDRVLRKIKKERQPLR